MHKIGKPFLNLLLLLALVSWCGMAQADVLASEIISIVDLESSSVSSNWTWRNTYKIWEANRKIFLYPDNWIEPELSGDTFAYFEAQLLAMMQNQITEVREAYRIWKENGQIFIFPENLLMPTSTGESLHPYAFGSDRLLAIDALTASLFSNSNTYSQGYLFLTGSPGMPVPEPATLVLFGIGIAGAATISRRARFRAVIMAVRSLMHRTS